MFSPRLFPFFHLLLSLHSWGLGGPSLIDANCLPDRLCFSHPQITEPHVPLYLVGHSPFVGRLRGATSMEQCLPPPLQHHRSVAVFVLLPAPGMFRFRSINSATYLQCGLEQVLSRSPFAHLHFGDNSISFKER